MDDIISILIWLFIIINVLASIKKNKKKQAETYEESDFDEIENYPEDGADDETIDFFGLKLPVQKKEEAKKISVQEPPESTSITTQTQYVDEKTAENIDSSALLDFSKMEEEIKRSQELEKSFFTDEKVGAEKTNVPRTGKSNLLKEKLRDKSELKRAVIFSEILNKPKALRKHG